MSVTFRINWVCGLCPSSETLNNCETTIRKLDLFPSSGEGREIHTLLGPLERANQHSTVTEVSSFYGAQQSMCLLFHT
jgi:hypothetical protein